MRLLRNHLTAVGRGGGIGEVMAQMRRVQAEEEADRLRRELRGLHKTIEKRVTKARCVVSKRGFIAGRSDAKTCSSKCRSALHRHS